MRELNMNLTKIVGGAVLLGSLSGCFYTCGNIDINQKESPLQDFDGDGKLDVLSCNEIKEGGKMALTPPNMKFFGSRI